MVRPPANRPVVRRLLRQSQPFWTHLVVLLVLSLLAPAVRLLSPLPLTYAVDCVIGDRPPPAFFGGIGRPGLLAVGGFLLVAVVVAGHVLAMAAFVLSTFIGERLVRGFRAILFRHS